VVPELLRAVALPLGEAAAQQLQHHQQQGGGEQGLWLSSSSSISLECALSILTSHQALGYQPSGSLLQALLAGVQPQLRRATAQQAAQALDLLALWGHHPGDLILSELAGLALGGSSSSSSSSSPAAGAAAAAEPGAPPAVAEAGGGGLRAEQAAEALYALAVLGHAPGELGHVLDWLVVEADCGKGLSMRAIIRLMFAIGCFGGWTIQRFGLLCVGLRGQQTGRLSEGQLLVLKQAQLLLGQLAWGSDCCSNADDRPLGHALLLQRLALGATGARRCVVIGCEGRDAERQRQQLLAAAAACGGSVGEAAAV
jgi:hypothetical protein